MLTLQEASGRWRLASCTIVATSELNGFIRIERMTPSQDPVVRVLVADQSVTIQRFAS